MGFGLSAPAAIGSALEQLTVGPLTVQDQPTPLGFGADAVGAAAVMPAGKVSVTV
jgi:hypothetical protein